MNCRFVSLYFVMFYYFYVPMFVVGYSTYFLSCFYAVPEIGLLDVVSAHL